MIVLRREIGKPVRELTHSGDTLAPDFAAPAELYPGRRKGKSAISYKRFDTAAEAVRFAIEELPPPLLLGTYLEVRGERFDSQGIRALYEHRDYPFPRAAEIANEALENGAKA